jgi:hypothetical protein
MDSLLTFKNVSFEDFLESRNCSNYPVLCRDMKRLIGNEKELSKELMSQFNQCQVLFETFDYEHFLIKIHMGKNLIEWIWGIFWLLCIEIIGNGCLFATIAYERFGMDPQKRTVINQLLSQCCWTIMLFNITSFPVAIFKRLLGPLNSKIFAWFLFNGRIFLSMISLLLSELIIFKSLYICKWSIMAMKDDNLISKIIFRINILLSSFITLQATMLDDNTCNSFKKTYTGRYEMELPTQICTISLNL